MGAVNDIIISGLECPLPRPQFAYVAPTYVQAKRIAWEYLKEYCRPLLYGKEKPNESELRVDILSRSGTPARIFLAGADNPDSLRGVYLDGSVIDEAALIPATVVTQVIIPALTDRGGWLMRMGTPKGKNHFYDDYLASQADVDSYTLLLPASKSGIIPNAELEELRRIMPPDEFEQEFECSFTAMSKGAILFAYVEQADRDGRISALPYPRDGSALPVYLSADIGFRDKAAFWWWHLSPGYFELVHYEEATGWEARDWIAYIEQVASELRYDVRMVHLPHDARAKTFSSKHTVVEQFLAAFGTGRVSIVPRATTGDRINAARTVLPLCRFWSPAVTGAGLKSLRGWTYSWDEINDIYSREPLHDIHSHGADGFSYGAQIMAHYVESMRETNEATMSAVEGKVNIRQAHYGFCLEELWEDEHAR